MLGCSSPNAVSHFPSRALNQLRLCFSAFQISKIQTNKQKQPCTIPDNSHTGLVPGASDLAEKQSLTSFHYYPHSRTTPEFFDLFMNLFLKDS